MPTERKRRLILTAADQLTAENAAAAVRRPPLPPSPPRPPYPPLAERGNTLISQYAARFALDPALAEAPTKWGAFPL